MASNRTVNSIEREMDRLRRQRDRLEYLGEDNFEEGAVIQFDKKFQNGQTEYSYVAVKAAGLWWLSGRETYGMSWESLCEMYLSRGVDKVWVVKEFEEI
jgi:hypothetical protein